MTTQNHMTMKEIVDWTNAWYQVHDTQEFLNPTTDDWNGHILGEYIYRHCGGIYNFENLDRAYAALHPKLHKKYNPKTPEQLAVERSQAIYAANDVTVKTWLRDICPAGVFFGADLFSGDQDKLVAYLQTTYDLNKQPV